MDITELHDIAQQERDRRKPTRIRCCTGAGCLSSGAAAVKNGLDAAVQQAGLEADVEVCGVGCMRFCGRGPLVEVDSKQILYEQVTPEDASSIIAALQGGTATAVQGDLNHPFFARQMPIVLENSGKIDPERI